uniref:Rab3 GTPase-activating protein catalytic subunit n=1 Tax=Chaetoceros debilis TaxID=122233 RepID=A0A7S3Q2Y0_9STRA
MDDEYIDYSCSTPIERLSRDVETLLRSWHIVQGSDRHVSFHDKGNGNGNSNGNTIPAAVAHMAITTSGQNLGVVGAGATMGTGTFTAVNNNSNNSNTLARKALPPSTTTTTTATTTSNGMSMSMRMNPKTPSPAKPPNLKHKLTSPADKSTIGSTPDPRTPPRTRSLVEQSKSKHHKHVGGIGVETPTKTPRRNLASILDNSPSRNNNTRISLSSSLSLSSPSPSSYISTPLRTPLRTPSRYGTSNTHNNNTASSPGSNFHTPPRNKADLYKMEDAKNNADIQLIRSGKIMFSIPNGNHSHSHSSRGGYGSSYGTTTTDRVDVELDLCLWDGPPRPHSHKSTKFLSDSFSDMGMGNMGMGMGMPSSHSHSSSVSSMQKHLPLSLTSNCQDPFPTVNILSNLSNLLGIGQHLTLSPSNKDHIEMFLHSTMQALQEGGNHPARGSGGMGQIHFSGLGGGVVGSMGFNNHNNSSYPYRNGHGHGGGGGTSAGVEEDVSLHSAALFTLSNQLQTALNLAAANCDCRLPAFGIWGHYGSNQNQNQNQLQQQQQQMNRGLGSGSGSGSGSYSNLKQSLPMVPIGGDTSPTLTQSVMEVPAWMNGGDLFNAASESSVCCIFRRYIEDIRGIKDGNGSSSIGKGGANGGGSGSGNYDSRGNKKGRGSASAHYYDSDSSDSSDSYDSSVYGYEDEHGSMPGTPGRISSYMSRSSDTSNNATPLRKGGKKTKGNKSSGRRSHIHAPVILPPTPGRGRRNSNANNAQRKNPQLYLPAFLMGKCHPGGSFLGTGAEFAIHVVPPGVAYPIHCTTLNSLGQLLLQHCPLPPAKTSRHGRRGSKRNGGHGHTAAAQGRESQSQSQSLTTIHGKVAVSGARHKYAWSKIFQFREDCIPNQEDLLLASCRSTRYLKSWDDLNTFTYGLSWRRSCLESNLGESKDESDEAAASVEQYKNQCRAHALKTLYRFSCLTKTKRSKLSITAKRGLEPLCGPSEDPLSLVSVHVTWSGESRMLDLDTNSAAPLLTLPLRIRSHNTMSSQDVLEMENTLLSTIFNPCVVPVKDFQISAKYDRQAACTTLGATNRCLLASLIRACTLGQSYLLGHLTNSKVLKELHERDELDVVADEIMTEADVSQVTRKLVEVMEWGSMADMMDDDASISSDRFHDIVNQMLGADSGQYPSPPEHMFDSTHGDMSENNLRHNFQANMQKSCRPGRLLSILFTSMAGLQTPSSMAALWMTFVSTLRMKWERRESLPNLGSIPGLDNEDEDGKQAFGAKKKASNYSSAGLGSKAKNSAFVNSSERDPGVGDCIINQKLHVFNVGVEAMVSLEMKKLRKKQSEVEKVSAYVRDNKANGDNVHLQIPQSVEQDSYEMDGESDNDTLGVSDSGTFDDDTCDYRSCVTREEFFDAVGTMKESGTGYSFDDGSLNDDSTCEYESPQKKNNTSGQHRQRRGARCPVSGNSSSGQIFAPYLQRDIPMTDDLIIERRKMLSKSSGSDHYSIQSRIEAAHRLQRRKLTNDMSAFKAANPKALFQDFVNWYGNPENPLDQYEDESSFNIGNPFALVSPSKTPEDEAMEAIFVLNATREFWGDCWNDSKPKPAADQEPLFDAFGTVEMLLLWFESMHPALLMNQVLAVNLAMSNFIVQSSAPSAKIRLIEDALKRLQRKTEHGLYLLSKDVTTMISRGVKSTGGESDVLDPFTYVSPDTISTCEKICSYIGDAETLIARATSLLTKLNGDVELVQTILEAPEGRNLEAQSSDSRSGILKEIHKQQQRNSEDVDSGMNDLPFPSVREYILRNSNVKNPCQLTACMGGTFGLEDGGTNSTRGGLVLAIKKCVK